jgi:RNA polymerase sigma-B factor
MAEPHLNLQQDQEGLVTRYLENPREDLRDLIIVQYATMVERIARRFAGIEPFEDLVQVGFIGLLNALSKFDPNAGVRFNTYATYLVAGEIKHYLRDRSQTIRHPAWLQELRHKVNRTASTLQQSLGRTPLFREIADELGISETAVSEVYQTQEMLRVASLDQPGANDDDNFEVDRLDAADFCAEQLCVEDRVLLENAMKQLRDLERQVLVLFHFEAMNQTEIANQLGISCNYVSHILRQSLAKLRKILSAEEEKDRLLRRQAAELDYDVIDPATGAYTEGYFHTRLQEEVHRSTAENMPMVVIVVKFYGLEALRRFYGEQSVIDFLSDATSFFKDNLRRLDVVAILGEARFGIILPAGAHVETIRQRLIKRAREWVSSRFVGTTITIELGHATMPGEGRSAASLLEAAQPHPHEGPETAQAA